jgi:hypothetical protein
MADVIRDRFGDELKEDEEGGAQAELDFAMDDVEDTDDGGALVDTGDDPTPEKSDHFANLAGELPSSLLSDLATSVAGWVQIDKEARKKRDEKYAEGIRRTGLGNDAPGGAEFTGASKVVHPLLTEATIDFAARAIRELFPPNGPAKDHIPGQLTQNKLEKARRKVRHLNWQLTVQMKEFRAELEQTLTQVPLGGAQYMKFSWDERGRKPTGEFVPIDDIYIPFEATNFYTARRKTHRQATPEDIFQQRARSGMYVLANPDAPAPTAVSASEPSAAARATAKIEGKDDTQPQSDDGKNSGERVIYECYCWRTDIEAALSGDEPDDDAELLPYIISVEEGGEQAIAVYRNWREDDTQRQDMDWIIEFPFVPWRGAYPIGLPHMIGDLSGAATGALRALLDAALLNNFPGLMKLKGATKGGQNITINPLQVTEIEGSALQDDVRKVIMPTPFNPPSAVLFQLLGFLVEAGRGVVRTTFDDLSANNKELPVGTTLALIEQGLTVFSAIHGRLHNAMQRLLDILCRINYMYLDDADQMDDAGELLARRSDYEGPTDVVPVSDPNIFSEVQRFAQIQAVVARSDAHPELYNPRAVEQRLLERLRIPQADELLRPEPEPKPMNAVTENTAAVAGRPLLAFPTQDHLAHLQAHLDFIASPMFGMSRLMAPSVLPLLLNHVKEHIAFWYVNQVYETVKTATEADPEQLFSTDPRTSQELDKLLAVASTRILASAPTVFEKIPPVIDAATKLLETLRPPMPQDPTVAASAAAQAETARKSQADALKAKESSEKIAAQSQRDQQQTQVELMKQARELAAEARDAQLKLQNAQADRAHETQLEQLRQAAEDRRVAAEGAIRQAINASDNQTARELALLEIEFENKIALSTGTGINP